MNRTGESSMNRYEGRILRTVLAVMLAVLISVWGIVPSSVVFAEEDAGAGTKQDIDKTDGEFQNSDPDQETDDLGGANEDPDLQNDLQNKEGKGGSDQQEEDASDPGTEKTDTEKADTEKVGAEKAPADDALEDAVASIGGDRFASLQEAVDAAQDGETVTLLKDISENVEIKSRNLDRVLTIDLGGHTLSPADAVKMTIYVNGGRDITIKNGKITGNRTDSVFEGAVHVLAKKATIDGVDFADNTVSLTSFFAATMVDEYHFEKRNININNCKFHGSGSRSGEKIYSAVNLTGYSVDIDKSSFYSNDRSLALYSQTPDNDVIVKYSITNTRFSNNRGQVIDAGIPYSESMYMYNVYVNNNDLEGSGDDLMSFHGVDKANREGSSASLNWCKIYDNKGAKHTIVTDSPSSLSLYAVSIENNSADETGAILAKQGYVIFNDHTVVRNNSATGTGDRVCGGVALRNTVNLSYEGDPGTDGHYEYSGGPASFQMYGGALYGNRSENGEFTDTDRYATPKASIPLAVNPEEFEGHSTWNPIEQDLAGYKWIEQKQDTEEDIPASYSTHVRVYKVAKQDENEAAAKTARIAAQSVYIDGVDGNDEGDGTREDPVRTFAKAKEILESKNAKVIYVLNKVTVTDNEEWSLPEGARMERFKEYTGIMAEVAKDASLKLTNITVDGAAGSGAKGVGSLIKVSGELNIEDGTLLQNNDIGTSGSKGTLVDVSGTVNINGGKLRGGEIGTNAVGAVYLRSNATCNMTGGTICDTVITESTSDRNDTAAVVLRSRATFNMSGGSIENNISRAKLISQTATSFTPQLSSGGISVEYNATVNISGDAVLKNNESAAGGAIFMQSGSIVNISGGTFEGNKARKNAGAIIVAGLTPKLTITGGEFKDNQAADEGGAIWTYGTNTVITGGKFTGNKATRYGGAIALAEYNGSFVTLKNAIIRNNHASIAGGGVWICPVGTIVFDGEEGVAIYDNKADGAGDDFVSVPNVAWWSGGVEVRKSGVYLSDTTLANQRVAWYKDGWVSFYQEGLGKVSDTVPRFDPENPGERVYVRGTKMSGLSLKSQISDEGKAKLNAIADSDNVVLFENNYAYRGGAIGGNSNVINTEDYENPEEEELRITKLWAEDIEEEKIPEEITVNLLLDGEVIDTLVIKKADKWEGKFRGLIKEYLDAGRYSIKEVEIEGFVAKYSDITWAAAPKQTEDGEQGKDEGQPDAADQTAATDESEQEDLTHVWTSSIENSKKPPKEVEEEEEEPKEPEKEVMEEEGEPEKADAKSAVKPAESNPVKSKSKETDLPEQGGTRTGDNMQLMGILVLLITAVAGAGATLYRRRRTQ